MKLYLALVHHPIVNKFGEIVATSVTNLDVHDIARSCKTFGLENYFIVTPIEAQKELLDKILSYWKTDVCLNYNPDRVEALSFIQLKDSVEMAIDAISASCGVKPVVVVTSANPKRETIGINDLKEKLGPDNPPVLILFGTGYGLAPSVMDMADFCLDPIVGTSKDGYNHLSVRSAVAIYCDRLMTSERS